MAESDIRLFDAIYTQRAIRSYKPDPVPEELIRRCIEAATKAPSGANSQPWAFVVLQDEATRKQLGEWARDGFEQLYENMVARMKPGDPPPLQRLKPMMESFETIPCWVIVCNVLAPGRTPEAGTVSSIYPAVQNFLLAARGLGLGSVLMSGWAQKHLQKIKDLIGMPENVHPIVFLPLGYPDKERYGKTTRRPVDEVTHWDKWEGEKGNSAAVAHR